MRSSIGATATAKRAALVCQARTPPCPSRRLPCQSRSPSLCRGAREPPRGPSPSELGTRPPCGWDPHESDVAVRGRSRCGPPEPLIRWGAACALARALLRALRRRYAPEPQGAAKALCLMEAAAAGTARCAGTRARSTGAESGRHDRRARALASAGAVPHGAGPAPQGHCRRAHRPYDGSRAAGRARRTVHHMLSSSAMHGRGDRRQARSRPGGGGITRRRPYAAGPLPRGTRTKRWEPRRRQGETCSPSRALFECDDGRDDRCNPAQAHET